MTEVGALSLYTSLSFFVCDAAMQGFCALSLAVRSLLGYLRSLSVSSVVLENQTPLSSWNKQVTLSFFALMFQNSGHSALIVCRVQRLRSTLATRRTRILIAAAAAAMLLAAVLCAVLIPVLSTSSTTAANTLASPRWPNTASSRQRGAAPPPESTPKQVPKIFTYEIVRELPHDPRAFTQGLQFDRHEGRETFWESTGMYGASQVREVCGCSLTGCILSTQSIHTICNGMHTT